MNNPENTPIIHVENLSHTFANGVRALKNINFQARRGQFILCTGRNGSGKTVFMRHLNALYLPTEGKVLIAGVNTRRDQAFARRTIGMVFQDADSQIVGQTVRQDISFGPENLRLPREEIELRVDKALETMELTSLADQRPHLLSGGEKRRLAIAALLAMNPLALILDEPFSNLDYHGVRSVLRHLVRLHGEGHTIILVTHEIEKAAAHAGRMILFDKGSLVEDGEPSSVIPKVGAYGMRPFESYGQEIDSLTWLK